MRRKVSLILLRYCIAGNLHTNSYSKSLRRSMSSFCIFSLRVSVSDCPVTFCLLVSRSLVESFCDGCVALAKEFSTAF